MWRCVYLEGETRALQAEVFGVDSFARGCEIRVYKWATFLEVVCGLGGGESAADAISAKEIRGDWSYD
jgi:hypothetical protein